MHYKLGFRKCQYKKEEIRIKPIKLHHYCELIHKALLFSTGVVQTAKESLAFFQYKTFKLIAYETLAFLIVQIIRTCYEQ